MQKIKDEKFIKVALNTFPFPLVNTICLNMPRKQLIRTDIYPYHVTMRSNNREWFQLPTSSIWDICITSLARANFKYPVQVESFLLMSNHYHLLIKTPDKNIDKFMHTLNSNISKEIRSLTNRINRIFGDRYKWQIIQNQRYYHNVVRYIFQNPVKAKIISNCEDYPYSTLYYQCRKLKLPFSLPKLMATNERIFFYNQRDQAEDNEELQKKLSSLGAIL